MNLFLFGWSAAGAVDAERAVRVLEDLRDPFLSGRPVQRWTAPGGRAAAAWVAHAPERVGGVRYAAADERRLALFSGRPLLWRGERADGRAPLDPLSPAWRADALDGRFAALRYEDGDQRPTALTDPAGAYPLFRLEAGRAAWLSNSPTALRALSGGSALDRDVLASLLGGGWSLSGDPVWPEVRRVGWGRSAREPAALCGCGFDAERAAALLVEALRGLADWPGRPNVVPVTGGRDSRLVLAAALRAGIEFRAVTGGAPDSPDVVIGRALAAAAGVEHALLAAHPHGDAHSRWRDAARVLVRTTGATATLADAAGFPLGPLDGPLELWHTGQGGEIARGYYGAARGDPVALLYRRFTGARPGRAPLLSDAGARRVREQLGDWVARQRDAGASGEDLPDLFYVHRRMATWAAPTHAAVEPVRDSTSPLWSVRLLGEMLGLPARRRAREELHLRVLEILAPELVDLPFEGGRTWPARRSALGRRAARASSLARRLRAELARRRPAAAASTAATATASAGGPPADPLDQVVAEVRDAALAAPDHPAWEVLDRDRVGELLGRRAAQLDAMSRQYVWRLATVFGGL